ncbi:MAG: transporter substrate-binding domain-containing protein [Oligoflexia bacterium]|nr:transporter substrate-binding domain-containing protein [Oligoflexia bacterium]
MKNLLLICCFLLSQVVIANDLKTVGQEESPAKFNQQDGKRPGICYEIIQAINTINPQIRFSGQNNNVPLKRIEAMLASGEIDISVCLLKSPDRMEKFNFIDIPLYSIKHVVMVNADDKIEIKNMEELKKLAQVSPVLAPFGSSLVNFLKSNGVNYIDNSQESANIKKLQIGRARFVYGQDISLFSSMEAGNFDKKKFKILATSFKDENQYIALSQTVSPAVINELKTAVEKLRVSGKLEEISLKYKR